MSKRTAKKTKGVRKSEYRYTVFFEPLEEGGYNVVVPAIPEICTFGETLQEAREMAQDAIRCYLESAIRTGERREKQIGVRLRADEHQALKDIAEREGYDSVSEFVRAILERDR